MRRDEKRLSAREYLSQLEVIDIQINQDMERLGQMKADAMSTVGFDYSQDRVQTSTAGNRLCSDVSRYVAFDERIILEIDRFIDAKEQIIREIRELHDANYVQVLYKVYVQFKTIKTASREMNRSYRYVVQAHNNALKAFEAKHQNLHYFT